MDLKQLRYFVAIYELGNLSHAASQSNVAQSALSHHLANLEHELGTLLFTRRARGMDPTAAGERLYKHAKNVFAELEQASLEIRSGGQRIAGEISVSMPYSVIKVIGIKLIQQVRERYPEVTLILDETLSGAGLQPLLNGDSALSLLYNPPLDERTRNKALLQEELQLIGHPRLLADAPASIPFAEIPQFPLMLLRSGVLARALVDKPQLLHSLERASTIKLASVAATIGALEEGVACTLAPRVLVKDQLKHGLLIARPVIDPNPVRTLYLVERSQTPRTFLQERIAALIEELVTDAVSSGDWDSADLL